MMWSSEQAAALGEVIEALNESGIQWLVLRNYEGLPETNRSKDIDLAFRKRDFTHAAAVITRALLQHGFNRIYTDNYQYVRCLTFFKVRDMDVISIKIDLLDGFVWRGAQLFAFKQLYATRTFYRNFFVPDTVDDGVMLWMKPLLTGGFIKNKYVENILRVSASKPDQFRARLIHIFGKAICDEMWPLIRMGRLEETIPYQRCLAWSAWRRAARISLINTLWSTLTHIYSEATRRMKRPPASLIAVTGPDGVGKTTFINLLQAVLAQTLVKDLKDIQDIHFRPNFLPNIKALLLGKRFDAAYEEFNKPHRAPPANPPSSLLRLIYYWTDYLVGYWLSIRRKCSSGKVVIFDRYFYDFIVDPRRSRINLPTWLCKLFLRMTPQPDIVFFLDCDADTVYARKQELSRDEIDRQLSEYRNLTANDPKRFVRLDASQSPEISSHKAVRELVLRSFLHI